MTRLLPSTVCHHELKGGGCLSLRHAHERERMNSQNATWRNVASTPRALKEITQINPNPDVHSSDVQVWGRGVCVGCESMSGGVFTLERPPYPESRASGLLRPLCYDSEVQTTCLLVPSAISAKIKNTHKSYICIFNTTLLFKVLPCTRKGMVYDLLSA